jgi:DNA modification methylase
MQASLQATNVLTEARKKYSQKELASLLDVSARTISRWESGEITPPTMVFPALTYILKQAENPVPTLEDISCLDQIITDEFNGKLKIEPALSRQLVSFQANKKRSNYRWYKYKEGFSASLVEYFLHRYGIESGKVLDPFAGSGTSLFVASELGIEADGIELLPIGQQIIETRRNLEREFLPEDFRELRRWINEHPWKTAEYQVSLTTVRITNGAYPPETLVAIESYLWAMQSENPRVHEVLRFALLCVLESVSFTRKDGQYLRWDHRSGRCVGAKPFNKGAIIDFDVAISAKLSEILEDVEEKKPYAELFVEQKQQAPINLFSGSCLEILPKLHENTYDAIITSPPYCNRYDYTRTYALELALLGIGEAELIHLRQQMLSCTVENRAKDLLSLNQEWKTAIHAADNQKLLQRILTYLDDQKLQGHLNNNGIPRMVRGYFYEMSCVIQECARVLKSNGIMITVNDNVRYAGASISVDLIFSDIAGKLGFNIEQIMVLPNGKGNSSQQMGLHGREPLRKCVYVWRKK